MHDGLGDLRANTADDAIGAHQPGGRHCLDEVLAYQGVHRWNARDVDDGDLGTQVTTLAQTGCRWFKGRLLSIDCIEDPGRCIAAWLHRGKGVTHVSSYGRPPQSRAAHRLLGPQSWGIAACCIWSAKPNILSQPPSCRRSDQPTGTSTQASRQIGPRGKQRPPSNLQACFAPMSARHPGAGSRRPQPCQEQPTCQARAAPAWSPALVWQAPS